VCVRDRRLQLARAGREAHDGVIELCSMLKVLGEVYCSHGRPLSTLCDSKATEVGRQLVQNWLADR
jgi:hypothetical protein